jgi:outer membrane biosynthesis protein TonB
MPSFRHGLLCTFSMLMASAAQAQSNSCELLKQTLAARIPPEIRGYAMDDVPAKTPVPSGGKVIGTCEGGARKVIYRRFGGAPLTGDDGQAPGSASAPAAPTPAAPPPVAVQKEVPKPKAETAAPKPVPSPPPALSPAVSPAPAPAPAVRAVPAPVVAPAPTPAVPPSLAPAVVEMPAKPPALTPPSATATADDGSGFIEAYGRWLWLLLALPFGAWLWAWISHRMAYDSAGLPRGPRL